jgi:aspartate/methionine/tyrosine aminotransferase
LVFVPELGYPHYRRVVACCGGDDVPYAVTSKSDWLPDFSTVSSPMGRIARMLFLNSPHNPTGAALDEKEMKKLLTTASKENVIVINDAAYQSLPESKQLSLLAVKNGIKAGAEIHSFSYTFGLPSLPFGFVAGHSEIINGLSQLERLSPQPVMNLFCDLALGAIRQFPSSGLKTVRRRISDSRGEAMKLLDVLELESSGHSTVPFIWAKINGRRSSSTAAKILYHGGKIAVVPGTEFGESGEGYLRFSLMSPPETYVKAIQRIKKRRRLFKLIED